MVNPSPQAATHSGTQHIHASSERDLLHDRERVPVGCGPGGRGQRGRPQKEGFTGAQRQALRQPCPGDRVLVQRVRLPSLLVRPQGLGEPAPYFILDNIPLD